MTERTSRTHSLDLVADQEDVVLAAQRLDLLEVVLVRNDDTARKRARGVRIPCDSEGEEKGEDAPGLALDRLDEERGDVLAVRVEGALESGDVVVRDAAGLAALDRALRADRGDERAEAGGRVGVGRHRDDADAAVDNEEGQLS